MKEAEVELGPGTGSDPLIRAPLETSDSSDAAFRARQRVVIKEHTPLPGGDLTLISFFYLNLELHKRLQRLVMLSGFNKKIYTSKFEFNLTKKLTCNIFVNLI